MTRALSPAPSGLKPVLGNYGMPGLGYGPAHIRDPLTLWKTRYQELGPASWHAGPKSTPKIPSRKRKPPA